MNTLSNRQVAAEAAAWFVECRAGDIDSAMAGRFTQWLRRSPEHIQSYLDVASAWAALPASDPHSRIDVQTLIADAKAEANVRELGSAGAAATVMPRPRSPAHRRTRGALAAAVVSVLIGGALIGWFVLERGVYATTVGEQRSMTLRDGSSVELNADSRVRVRFDRHRRSIELLRGQALFTVAKDASRPFVVESDALQILAVGTAFDVNRKQRGTVVTVLEGRVAVSSSAASAPRHSSLLAAGQQIVAVRANLSSAKPSDTVAATAWRQKQLIFEETPLLDVAEEFNRHNGRRLLILDPKLQAATISGIYSSTDPASLIRFLSAQPTIQVNEFRGEIQVTRK